jgi:chitin synthase
MNPNASRHGRYFELHFTERGRISGGKILTYGLEKSRVNRLTHEERTFHIFYQLLAGSTAEERDRLNLEDPSDYALLASSGCYRLPAGPFSDDSIAMDELRAAMKTLGFKPKHIASIFSLLVAILTLGNIQFGEGDARDVSAYIMNPLVLDQAARLLGVSSEELGETLTNKTSYVRKELYTVMLNATQSAAQRDSLVRDLYAILFAFVVETANHRIAPGSQDPLPATQIVLLDQPGFQTRGPGGTTSVMLGGAAPLVSAYGQNGFDEFCINFADEVLHSYVVRNAFEDSVGYNAKLLGDGITLPAVTAMDNSACIELLRGAQLDERAHRKPSGVLGAMNKACSAAKSGKGSDKRDEELLQDLAARFGSHGSFAANPQPTAGSSERRMFGINHYAGSVTYDAEGFVEKDVDLLDAAFVTLLRNSKDTFVAKLMSGPSLAAERHSKDDTIIVQTQVSSRPLRQATAIPAPDGTLPAPTEEHPRLDPTKSYPVTTQINYNLSEIIYSLDRTRHWTVSCIRPNDSGSPNSFDKRRVKLQIRTLLLPDLVVRRKTDYVVDMAHAAFCDRYVPTMQGSESERIRQCAQANGWQEGVDYAVGISSIWLSYSSWKMVEDVIRSAEKEAKKLMNGGDDEESVMPDDATEYSHRDANSSHVGGGGFYGAESEDNLLLTRTATNGTNYRAPNANMPYGNSQLAQSHADDGPAQSEAGWGSEWDKGGSQNPAGKEDIVVKEVPNAVEEVPTTRTRKFWLWVVWGSTWWIPSFLLSSLGGMKRADVRLAWREKFAIFWLILLLNGIIIFYIIEFGRLLCPNFDKAWTVHEVGEHTASNDYWVAIQGVVYDVSNFIHGQHSDIPGEASNGADTLDVLAGQDLTGYFPPPVVLACSGLVNDPNVALRPANFTPVIPTAMHTSGALASAQQTKLDEPDWYTSRFLETMKSFRKGPMVWGKGDIWDAANSQDSPRYVF